MSAAPSHEPHLRRSPLLPLLICAGWMVGCTPPQPERLAGSVMGTTWSVQIVGVAGPDLQDAIQDRLDTINAQMTTYSPASELSRFNSNSSTEWLPASTAWASS